MSSPDFGISHLRDDAPHAELARAYLDLLLAKRRAVAGDLVLEAVREGVPVKEIYLHVFQPVQRELGRLWQADRVSVEEEHFCTEATQLIISRLYPWVFSGVRDRGRLVATTAVGELHELGIRMVADFFEMAGWDTSYVGAGTPPRGVAHAIETRKPDLLAVSATLLEHVEAVEELIREVRAVPAAGDLIVLTGGRAFNTDPELWVRVGADGFAPDAEGAVARAQALMAERAPNDDRRRGTDPEPDAASDPHA